jgi:hypothetical protein
MNPDYSIRSLKELDVSIPDSLKEMLMGDGYNPGLAETWLFYAGLGSYFGEVLIRNLNGRWRYPNRLTVLLANFAGRPDWIYRHWYVTVGGKRIPVFKIAEHRWSVGREQASLMKAYQEIELEHSRRLSRERKSKERSQF